MNNWLKLGVLSCASAMNLAGCTVQSGDESETATVDVLDEPIVNGMDVQPGSPFAKSTVAVDLCTGTIIGPRHVIAAAHCGPSTSSTVTFYVGNDDIGGTRGVSKVMVPFGVSVTDTNDDANKFADYMVLELSSPIPSGYMPAKIAPTWPGNNVLMYQVGRGDHDGYDNPGNFLRYRSTRSYSASNAEGHVLVESVTNWQDSGGPIFTLIGNTGVTLHGVNWGNVFEWAMRGKYTSTAFHFWDISRAVGMRAKSHWNFPGNDIASTDNVTLPECVSLCMANPACNAYTLTTVVPGGISFPPFGRCYQKSVSGTGGAAQGRFSGVRETTGICTVDAGGVCRI